MNWSSLLVYMAVMSITPGPNNLTCLYLGASSGFGDASCFMSGSMLGLFVKTLLCGLLNVLIAERIPGIVPWLKWIGAAYMLYLAFNMAKSGFSKETDEVAGNRPTVLSGILLQCLNVKSWIAALSIFSVFVVPYVSEAGMILAVSAVFFALALASSLIWLFFGKLILRKAYEKWRIHVCLLMAASLVYCAYTAVAP